MDAAQHGWMAPFALIFLSGGLALFWGLAFWVAHRLSRHPVALAVTWTGVEMLRAYVFTGFPWASPAQVLVDGSASQILAWVGPHGATFSVMLVAAVLSLSASGPRRFWARIGQGTLLLASALVLYLPLAQPRVPETLHTVRLIQPNAAQHLKWDPNYTELFFNRQLELTRAPPSPGQAAPDLVIWPETAIPWRLETAEPILQEIARAGGAAPVALGVLRSDGTQVRNALALLDSNGGVSDVYDKHHLVPFGEYVPLAALAHRFGIRGLVEQGVGFAPGPGPQLLDLGALGRALPLICYEAVFAHGVGRAPERADFLLQITNDAWFGTHAGPQQHVAQARMRAIEQGLPMLRAANTGVSAVIDPFGRVLSYLPLGTAGFLDAALPKPLPPTFYSQTGDALMLIFLVSCLFMLLLNAKRAAQQKEIDLTGNGT